ncbi:TetR family transcriptional regulator [Actinoplanes sp. LDG1-06]|uniref:TetR family transcriptional regulator n=1 Tax=Paractinoplanes ovalisporus TaxID=2810368 RepID=A0ABS2ANK7_9ACTN|nr:TetR family transcriptional regulator [Actinoplanes ovalisporus]MBM2621447.1 TetR family transcriptional regulator [Actinoplanes ovalisporus]
MTSDAPASAASPAAVSGSGGGVGRVAGAGGVVSSARPGAGASGAVSSARPGAGAGLRERKKAKTRAAIREAAMDLFNSQGYAATTVEQIAEAAEVSPSTFFRYFPTKEDVVLIDDYDPLIVEAIRAQPPELPVVDALLLGMREVFEHLTEEEWASERRRQELFRSVPELLARQMQATVSAIDLLTGVIAERMGVPRDNTGARALAGAFVGVALTFLPPGRPGHFDSHDFDRIRSAMIGLRTHLDPLTP